MIQSDPHEELFLAESKEIRSFEGERGTAEQVLQDETEAVTKTTGSTSLNQFIQIQNAEYTRSQGGRGSGDIRPDDISETSHTTSVDTTTSGLNASRKVGCFIFLCLCDSQSIQKFINKDGKPTSGVLPS